MRSTIQRRFALFFGAAFAAVAIAAPVASAEPLPVAVKQVSSGEYCNDTVAGRCLLKMGGPVTFEVSGAWKMSDECWLRYDLAINTDGSMEVSKVFVEDGYGNCLFNTSAYLTPCNGKFPWLGQTWHDGEGGLFADQEVLFGPNCEPHSILGEVAVDNGNLSIHFDQQVVGGAPSLGVTVEMDGDLSRTSGDQIEVETY